jgi:hypothetical protein
LLAKVDSNVCNVSIPNDNVELLAKIEELNISLASLRIENEKLIAKLKILMFAMLPFPTLEVEMIYYMLRL